MTKGKYTCFLHPRVDFELRHIDDRCPDCDRPYRFPLTEAPSQVRDYSIIRSIDRGFYGAIYEAERRGIVTRKSVLKIIPVGTYETFSKSFEKECQDHQLVADETEHLVDILEAFDEVVDFSGVEIKCHVAELRFVDGMPLSEFLDPSNDPSARTVAQVAVDLIRLMQELENKQKYHNDLHDKNIIIQQLVPEQRRAEAIDDGVRAVAVDLGSIGDASRSDPGEARLGDLEQVVNHLLSLRERLLDTPTRTPDLDYRLASVLDEVAQLLAPDPTAQRTPDYGTILDLINQGFRSAASPWMRPPPR